MLEQLRTKLREVLDDRVNRAWLVAGGALVAILLVATQLHS
jgi:hypothetical protein